jgi:hypothetical protein
MRFLHLSRLGTAIVSPFLIPSLTCAVFTHTLTAGSAVAQQSIGTIQTTLTENDHILLEMFLQRAYSRSASVRELRVNRWSPLLEGVEIEAQVSPESTTDVILNPINLVNGLMQQPVISAQLREERAAIRVAVLEAYVEHIRSRQSRHLARLAFDEVLANIFESSQVVNGDAEMLALEVSAILPSHPQLAQNQNYVDAANELFTAQTDEIIALERLSGLVGMALAEILAHIERYSNSAIANPLPNLD